jgi:hypothetical protein
MQASEVHNSAQVDLSDLALSRNYYLNDLLQPLSYAPGGSSFVFHRGQRKTVLDLTGSGSVAPPVASNWQPIRYKTTRFLDTTFDENPSFINWLDKTPKVQNL